MNQIIEFIVNAIGWTLLHSVWQGMLIGLLFLLSKVILNAASPVVRHANALLWLLLFMALPLITFITLLLSEPVSTSANASQLAMLPLAIAPDSTFHWTAAMPVLFALWLSGVLILSYQLARDWHQLVRVTQTDATGLPQLEATVDRLRNALSVSASVRLVEAVHATVPMVVGVIKPMIVIPSSVLLGLSPRELELIIAHELGHLKRRDHLINYVLIVAETLLFFHPVVYSLTRTIRHERELCCDDLVISTFHDRVCYAHALSKLETLRACDLQAVSQLQLAAADGPLVTRIARLVSRRHHRNWVLLPTALLPLAAALLVVAVFDSSSIGPTDTDATLSVSATGTTLVKSPLTSSDDVPALQPIRLARYERRTVAPASVSKITSALTRQLNASRQRNAGRLRSSDNDSSTIFDTIPSETLSQVTVTPEPLPSNVAISDSSPIHGDTDVQLKSVLASQDTAQARVLSPTKVADDAKSANSRNDVHSKTASSTQDKPVVASEDSAIAVERQMADRDVAPNASRIVYDMTEMDLPFVPAALRKTENTSVPRSERLTASTLGTNGESSVSSRSAAEVVSGGDLIFSVTPRYPDRARSRGLVDRVVVSMKVGADGSVNQVSFVNSDSRPMFQRAVKRAVKRWKFEPLLRNGEPVEQTVEQSFNFTLAPYSASRRGVSCRDSIRSDCRVTT